MCSSSARGRKPQTKRRRVARGSRQEVGTPACPRHPATLRRRHRAPGVNVDQQRLRALLLDRPAQIRPVETRALEEHIQVVLQCTDGCTGLPVCVLLTLYSRVDSRCREAQLTKQLDLRGERPHHDLMPPPPQLLKRRYYGVEVPAGRGGVHQVAYHQVSPSNARIVSLIASSVCSRFKPRSRRNSFQTYTSQMATSSANRRRRAVPVRLASRGANVRSTHS